ncbi:iron-dependent extradiol dioxygenase HsaC [soil metagenome]
MAEISTLGYAVIGVSDLAAWRDLATLLGFHVDEDATGALLLRMDDHAQRLLLESGHDDDLRAMGWEFASADELHEYVAQLAAKGVAVEQADAAQAEQRKVQELWRSTGPDGGVHEFHVGPVIANTPFRSEFVRNGFVAGELGFGHILLRVPEVAAALDFACGTLGLRLSDTIIEEATPDFSVEATFMHARSGRHHSLAVARMPGTRNIGHLMVEVPTIDEVGQAYERCIAAGVPIRAALGRHPNDQMFSFYIDTPSGFAIEYGTGGLVIGEDWVATTFDRLSDWGHRRQPRAIPAR